MIVVDSNVIAYLMIPGDRTACAREALRVDPDWVSPILWRSEFRSVLTQYLTQGHLKIEDALRLVEAAEQLMRGREYEIRSADVLRLAVRSRCSAYDCEFVALAEDLGVPLITTDRAILKAFPSIAVSLDQFVA